MKIYKNPVADITPDYRCVCLQIDTHRKNLLAKFNAKNTATLIIMALQMKIV